MVEMVDALGVSIRSYSAEGVCVPRLFPFLPMSLFIVHS
jgi:hypothetical protein